MSTIIDKIILMSILIINIKKEVNNMSKKNEQKEFSQDESNWLLKIDSLEFCDENKIVNAEYIREKFSIENETILDFIFYNGIIHDEFYFGQFKENEVDFTYIDYRLFKYLLISEYEEEEDYLFKDKTFMESYRLRDFLKESIINKSLGSLKDLKSYLDDECYNYVYSNFFIDFKNNGESKFYNFLVARIEKLEIEKKTGLDKSSKENVIKPTRKRM